MPRNEGQSIPGRGPVCDLRETVRQNAVSSAIESRMGAMNCDRILTLLSVFAPIHRELHEGTATSLHADADNSPLSIGADQLKGPFAEIQVRRLFADLWDKLGRAVAGCRGAICRY